MDEVDIGGLRIAFRRAGNGPPLILLHGGLSDSRCWRKQLEGLSDAFTLIAWDAPGCGQSSDPPPSFRLPDYADALARFLGTLGISRAHVLGLSFGGGLALELYRRHPELPRSLVLASAYAGWAGSLSPDEVEQRLARGLRDAERPAEEWASGYLDGMFTEAAPREAVGDALAMMLDTRPAGMVPMLYGFAEADLRDVLPRIVIPTLLLYGDRDQRAPPYVAQALHAQIPGSRLVVMAGVGHDSNIEDPTNFNAVVRDFLNSAPE